MNKSPFLILERAKQDLEELIVLLDETKELEKRKPASGILPDILRSFGVKREDSNEYRATFRRIELTAHKCAAKVGAHFESFHALILKEYGPAYDEAITRYIEENTLSLEKCGYTMANVREQFRLYREYLTKLQTALPKILEKR